VRRGEAADHRLGARPPVLAWSPASRHSAARISAPPHIHARRRDGALSAEILLDSSFLPGAPPHDLADCIIAVTAREHGYTVMTRDAALLAYAREGHLSAVEC
jgi:predicted nucleic acid-binding protein